GNLSKSSAPVKATPKDKRAPAAPANLNAERMGKNHKAKNVKVTWNRSKAKDLAQYVLFRRAGKGKLKRIATRGKKATQYIDRKARNKNRVYNYWIAARDTSGNRSKLSARAHVPKAASDTTAPAVPTGLEAEPGDGKVVPSWNANEEEDFDHYVVYRDGDELAEVSKADEPEYVDSDVKNGTAYSYTVAAVDEAGNASKESDPKTATPKDTTEPAAPTGLKATAGDAAIDLTWEPNDEEDVAGYNVYRAESDDVSTDGAPLNDELLADPEFTDDTAEPGTEYFYVVTAVDKAGNKSDP